ncbi:MAG: hypothetical protein ACTHOH_05385 [Lysobacteraceae bacterium]
MNIVLSRTIDGKAGFDVVVLQVWRDRHDLCRGVSIAHGRSVPRASLRSNAVQALLRDAVIGHTRRPADAVEKNASRGHSSGSSSSSNASGSGMR